MRICLIGKYPPIEGGVSASNYWLANGLAERGHEVTVVTNADEVEDAYRMRFLPGDKELYAPSFPETGGSVSVFTTQRPGRRMTHIPTHNPFTTKLAGLATQTIRARGCEAIFAYYFEPYAIAAYLASAWTGIPWVVRHAGSDLDRLMAVPELGTAYKEALRAADGVLTRSRQLADRFLGAGVPNHRLFRTEPFSPPASFFNPGAKPLTVDELPKVVAPVSPAGERVAFDPSRPTIGIYGKVGAAKGSFDLLHALSILRGEGLSFQFLALTQGRGLPAFARAVRDLELDDRTWILPFMANWHIPSFIRTCTAVCFLERDFPVKIHSPVVSNEIFAAGGCLVVSGEIARKHVNRDSIVDGETVLLVDDPKDHDELAAKLRRAVEDPDEAERIGRRGLALANDPGMFDRYVESYEQILIHVTGGDAEVRTFDDDAPQHDLAAASGGSGSDPYDLLRRMPWLGRILPSEAPGLVQEFYESTASTDDADPISAGLAFCDFFGDRLQAGRIQTGGDVLEACLRFQIHRWQALRDTEVDRRRMAFGPADRLSGAAVSSPEAGALRPLRSRHAEVIELEHDVLPLFTGSRDGGTNGFDIEKCRTIVCFLRASNLKRTEVELSAAARELIDLCDGSRSTDQIVEILAERRELPPGGLPGHREQVVSALQDLYDKRIIVFCSGVQ